VTNVQAVNQQLGVVLPRLPMAVLFLTLFAMAVSLSFVFAALPPIGRGLGLSELQLGMVVAPAALVFVVANGVWGGLSERLGRKPVIVVAVTAAALASGACGWIIDARASGNLSVTATFASLAGCRILLGAFAGGLLPATQAYIADTTLSASRTQALALIGAGFALGLVTGPGLAAAAAGFGVVVPFYAVAALAAATALFVLFTLTESRRSHPGEQVMKRTTSFRQLWALLAIIVLTHTAYGILLQVTGFRMQDQFSLSSEAATRRTGIALMVAAAGLVCTQILIARSRLSLQRSERALLVGGVAALAAMMLLILVEGFRPQLVGMALFGVGLGLVLPSALGLLTVVAEAAGDQGRVGGWSGAAQGLGMVFGPLAGAVGYRFDHTAPYLVGVGLLIVTTALSVLATPILSASPQDQPNPTFQGAPHDS